MVTQHWDLSDEDRTKMIICEAERLAKEGPFGCARAVVSFAMAAIELGSVDGLEKCIHMLVEGDGVEVDAPRAMRNIDSFVVRAGERREGGRSEKESATGVKLLKIWQLYEELLVRVGFQDNVVVEFMNILSIVFIPGLL